MQRVGPRGKVVGVDASSEMLEQARSRAGRQGWRNVSLIEGSIDEVELPNCGAALFSFTHDVLQSPAAVDNVLSCLAPEGRVASVGAKWAGRWNLPVNLVVRRLSRPFVTTFQGFDRPWRLLEERMPNLQVESAALGGAYIAWGEMPATGANVPPAASSS